jgi:hypothetical protein
VLLIVLPLLGSLLLVFVVIGALFILCKRARKRNAEPENEQDQNIFTILGHEETTKQIRSSRCRSEEIFHRPSKPKVNSKPKVKESKQLTQHHRRSYQDRE